MQSGVCNGRRLTVQLLFENIIVAKTTILISQIKLATSNVNLPCFATSIISCETSILHDHKLSTGLDF